MCVRSYITQPVDFTVKLSFVWAVIYYMSYATEPTKIPSKLKEISFCRLGTWQFTY